MAKLITKFKFIQPGGKAGSYLKYIATREGVDKIDDSKALLPVTKKQKDLIAQILRNFPDAKEMHEYDDYQAELTIGSASEFITRALEDNAQEMMSGKTYADYIATRPRAQRFGSHGLFTDDGVEINLTNVSEELCLHQGNVWTAIISLRREDAARLGFDDGYRWRDMLRTQTQALSKNLKIPMENLRWFAAFHNESHHPHVHLIAYSMIENEGYLTKQGLNKLRSSFAKDIFAQDHLHLYQEQTEYRDTVKAESRALIAEIISKINSGVYDNPKVEIMLITLAGRLERTSGKKVYGYLKEDVKDLIDSIVDEVAKDERVSALYNLWYQKREKILETYTEKMPDRIPLSQNKEFKSIRNAVIQEAVNISAERMMDEEITDEDIPAPEYAEDEDQESSDSQPVEPELPESSYHGGRKKEKTWWTDEYKAARNYLYGTKNTPPDFSLALSLMTAEAKCGNGFAMYDLGRMYLSGLGCDEDEKTAQEWFGKACSAFISKEQTAKKKDYFQYRIGKLNALGYGVEQDHTKAAEWYEKAAELNNDDARYGLGKLYLNKDFTERNPNKAVDWLIVAAQNGHTYAQYTLGKLFLKGEDVPKNPTYALAWLEKAVEQENSAAEYLLGKTLLLGEDAQQDIGRGTALLSKAAEDGNECAAYTLGKAYLDGTILLQDIPKAIHLLTQSADKGFTPAQYIMGKLLYRGQVIPQDIGKALFYLENAAEKENSYAAYLAGKIRLTEKGFKDIPKAIHLFRLAVEQGNDYPEYQLGKLYLYGKEVERDYEQSIRWLTASAEHGNQYAAQLLHSIRSNKNWTVAMGALRLLQRISRMIQKSLEDDRKGKSGMIIDRKLRRKIEEKNQALGIKQG